MIDVAFVFAGALTGFVVGLTGVGGGALMNPILLLFFGVTPITAIATDLWFAALTKIIGARMHHAAGLVDWQVVKKLWLGSLPVALFVVLLVNIGDSIAKVDWLTQAIGLVLLVTAVGLLFSPTLRNAARNRRIGQPTKFKAAQANLTVLAGAVLGLCVALTSIGAGALGSVILLYLYPLRMTSHRLVATDLMHAIPLAAIAGLGYLIAGMVDGWMLASLLLGSAPAVVVGSFLAGKFSERLLQICLASILFVVGLKVVI